MLIWVLDKEEEDLGTQVAPMDLEAVEMAMDQEDQVDLVVLVDPEGPADLGVWGIAKEA